MDWIGVWVTILNGSWGEKVRIFSTLITLGGCTGRGLTALLILGEGLTSLSLPSYGPTFLGEIMAISGDIDLLFKYLILFIFGYISSSAILIYGVFVAVLLGLMIGVIPCATLGVFRFWYVKVMPVLLNWRLRLFIVELAEFYILKLFIFEEVGL